jgi:hypothetical protein
MAVTRQKNEKSVSIEQPGVASLVDVLIEIGLERARILERMKEALERGDDAEALEYARELTGLSIHKSPVSSVTT